MFFVYSLFLHNLRLILSQIKQLILNISNVNYNRSILFYGVGSRSLTNFGFDFEKFKMKSKNSNFEFEVKCDLQIGKTNSNSGCEFTKLLTQIRNIFCNFGP